MERLFKTPKTATICIRLSPRERAHLAAYAEQDGLTLAEAARTGIRTLTLKDEERESKL